MNEIDLTNYFKKRYRFEEINNVSIDGKNYIFKFLPRDNLFKYDLENFYNDLIVSELCKKVGIESCKVYLGKYKNRYGTLVENYKTNDKAIYVNGSIILKDYLKYLEKNHLVNEYLCENICYPIKNEYRTYLINKMNNLEIIWDALNYHFINFSDSKRCEIVKKIMDELTKRYSLDYLVMQTDRHERNWEIEETLDDAFLTPLYDNELSFCFDSYVPELKVDINNNIKFDSELEKYLSFSSDYYKEEFVNLYNILTPEFLENTIKQLEIRMDFSFPVIYKQTVIKNYSKHYNDITSILNKTKNKR